MIGKEKILGLITARGGSKGVPRKNIKLLGDKPLIAWTIEAAQQSTLIDRLILSSDDQEIIDIAQSFNCEAPFIRPSHLATDESSSIETALHALENVAETYNYLVLLQPTSPFRTTHDIDNCIKTCHEKNASSCVSVCEPTQNPYWMFSINRRGFLTPIFNQQDKTRRQDLPKAYVVNGAVYVVKVNWLLKKNRFVTQETLACEMPQQRSFDIDTEFDFKIAEAILKIDKKNEY